ncbi:MAG: hypothetical protein PVJ02_00720 [Gemmatimonadota bacterium]
MANVDEKVLAAVEAALKKDPAASVDELFEMARGINSDVGKLTKRQFHARYPLQIKRKMNPPKRRKASRRKAGSQRGKSASANGSVREAVRQSFLKFASDLAGAEERKDVVKVVAGVDRYVDEVLKATHAN